MHRKLLAAQARNRLATVVVTRTVTVINADCKQLALILDFRSKFILERMLVLAQLKGASVDFWDRMDVFRGVIPVDVVLDRARLSLPCRFLQLHAAAVYIVRVTRVSFLRVQSSSRHSSIDIESFMTCASRLDRLRRQIVTALSLVLDDHLLDVFALLCRHRLLKE